MKVRTIGLAYTTKLCDARKNKPFFAPSAYRFYDNELYEWYYRKNIRRGLL